MLQCILPGYTGSGRTHKSQPFCSQVPGFFSYLQEERGLRPASILHYQHNLRKFQKYLHSIDLHELSSLSPELISSFITDRSGLLSKSSRTGLCVCLRVFLQYLHRERLISRDLSCCVESPRSYRCAHIPRLISWDEVGQTLQLVDFKFPLKTIGDYVGHRSPSSTEIYTKIEIEPLRQLALGDGEDVL